MPNPVIDFARRKPLAVGGGVLALVVVAGLGAFALGGGTSGEDGVGPSLGIAVVAPNEPDIQAGDRMGVGQLVNDFDAEALADAQTAPPPDDFAQEGVQDGWIGADRPGYDRRPYGGPKDEPGYGAVDGPRGGDWRTVEGRGSDGRGDRRGLGFDGPRPESGAEREARMGPPKEKPVRSGASGDPDAAFY
jgi:hypothetical protein